MVHVNDAILINRAPVLALWASVVAERLGYNNDEALSLGKAVCGLNAQSKGRRLGIYKPQEKGAEGGEKAPAAEEVELMGRHIPVARTEDGLRAVCGGRPVSSESVERYFESKFGESLPAVRAAMTKLAQSFPPAELAARAFALYEKFRPAIPEGVRGWGAKGKLDIGLIKRLAVTTT